MSVDAQTTILLWALILPIIGALGVVAFGRWPNLRDSWTVVIGISTFSCVVRLVGPVMDGARPGLPLPDWKPGLGLGFEVEPLVRVAGVITPVSRRQLVIDSVAAIPVFVEPEEGLEGEGTDETLPAVDSAVADTLRAVTRTSKGSNER